MSVLPTLLLAVTLGCAPAPQTPAVSTTAVSTQATGSPAPETVVQKRPDPPQTGTATQQAAQDDKPRKWRKIEERLFQLDDLQRVPLKINGKTLMAWVMDSDMKRQEGMMFVKDADFKEDEGMIFAFPNEDFRRFWMRNTLVPLDIAYCDKDGRVLNTYTMRAMDETTDYSSRGRSMFVVETKAGVMKKWGIKAGDRFEIPEDVVARD